MISPRLFKAQTELLSHRAWLNSFVTRHRCRALASTSCDPTFGGHARSLEHHARPKPWTHDPQRLHQKAGYATKRLKIRKTAAKPNESLLALHNLRQAIQDVEIERQIDSVMQSYADITDKAVVRPNDVRIIAQCLHHSLRVERRAASTAEQRDRLEGLVAFAETLVKDIMAEKVPPHCQAHVHLVGFFKESGVRDAGVRFWQWLQQQDDLHVNPDVYGAAIELLAVNGASLPDMEQLYEQALERFPGNFSAYHLSPNAIVPDREQATTLQGVPMTLLQGILTARLLHGDTQNAYLALDTALRLYPDQVPPRFFFLFLEERPVFEAYTVFNMACRSGVVMPVSQFRHILGALRTSSDMSSPVRHALVVRAMLSIVYMYRSAGGQLSSNVLNEIAIAITQFLRLAGMNRLKSTERQEIATELMEAVRSLLLTFAICGVKPGLSTFNSIITNLAGFGHSKEIAKIALTDMKALDLTPNQVTRRSVLTAAGVLKDAAWVVQAWADLTNARMSASTSPDATDFHVLIKSATATGQIEFARSQVEEWKSMLPNEDHYRIQTALEDAVDADVGQQMPAEIENRSFDLTSLSHEIRKVSDDVSFILEGLQDKTRTVDSQALLLPMTLTSGPSPVSLPESEMRSFYDELTSEQSSHAGKEPGVAVDLEERVATPSASSSTNIPFGVLRYESWKTINYLLHIAGTSDANYLKAVDEAIANGAVPPQRTFGLSLEDVGVEQSHGLSDGKQNSVESELGLENPSKEQIQQRKDRVLSLRGQIALN